MGSLAALMRAIDGLNQTVGKTVAWLAVIMVVTQFSVVVMRYVFGIGSIMMQESVVYMHSFLFMVGAGYTLLHNGHVRVDVFYREASIRNKAIIDLFGVVFLLLPVCLLIFTSSWDYVIDSWAIFEGSKETSGIHALFILKSIILVFCVLLALQGIAMALRSFLILKGALVPEEDHEVHEVP
ncbi:Tripartite ATP-independent periplasmic transporter, DctQ component [Candidatus Terasakiella magnetica]|uniref:TRAP transporter small permease protein n=1 Tax=Candidatus Terasakiella magnetica TaxID=1867952 RepID=A0A1C3RD16_9PROT|nr:TRAP transporter small permease subunit [Candidatus Terasakiella magnetica]SCA55104.1 Tripartite ATP-independent periplasmic transporter, DctQ component [Candidatus Terasakiella magnetica]